MARPKDAYIPNATFHDDARTIEINPNDENPRRGTVCRISVFLHFIPFARLFNVCPHMEVSMMSQYILYGALALLFFAAAIRLFNMPFKPVIKILVNVTAGFVLLIAFNIAGQPFHMTVGVNAVNVGVIAVLGVPGFAMLLLVQLIFR